MKQRLRLTFGIVDIAHRWFQSYLTDTSVCVAGHPLSSWRTPRIGSRTSFICFVHCRRHFVDRNSCHGPTHLYADDTQIYGLCLPAAVNTLSSQISGCISDVAAWMKSNRLQLNSDKTEVLWCTTNRRLHQLPVYTAMLIDGVPITPALYVRDLGIYLDSDLWMQTHVQ